MNKLASIALMSCFATGAIANDTKLIGEAYKKFGDVAFAPVRLSSYEDQYGNISLLAEVTKLLGSSFATSWLIIAPAIEDVHKKAVYSKSIIANASANILSNADIDSILAEVDETGVRGPNRIQLIVENRASYSEVVPEKLSSKNSEIFIREKRSDQRKLVTVKDLSKKELEHALQNLANNNIKAYSVKVGTVKTSALKVGGSTLAVYLVLDLAHSLSTKNM